MERKIPYARNGNRIYLSSLRKETKAYQESDELDRLTRLQKRLRDIIKNCI